MPHPVLQLPYKVARFLHFTDMETEAWRLSSQPHSSSWFMQHHELKACLPHTKSTTPYCFF
jgi:hypothetical protein